MQITITTETRDWLRSVKNSYMSICNDNKSLTYDDMLRVLVNNFLNNNTDLTLELKKRDITQLQKEVNDKIREKKEEMNKQ